MGIGQTQRIFAIAVLMVMLTPPTQSLAQTAFFSVRHQTISVDEELDLSFVLSRSVGSDEVLEARTYGYAGGTSVTGYQVTGRAFDSELLLFDDQNALRAQSHQISGTNLDSYLSWPQFQSMGTPINPDPLPAGAYRLIAREYGGDDTGLLALDVLAPADAVEFTAVQREIGSPGAGYSFGTIGEGDAPAVFRVCQVLPHLSSTFMVPSMGKGELHVENGGRLSSGRTYVGGADPNLHGVAYVSGAGARWDVTDDLNIYNGELVIENGGIVTDPTAYLGINKVGTSASVIVRNPGSQWYHYGTLHAGWDEWYGQGYGNLDILDGGFVSSEEGSIQFSDVRVSGPGSRWQVRKDMTLGGDHAGGELIIENGGLVTAEFTYNSGWLDVRGSDSVYRGSRGMDIGGTPDYAYFGRILLSDGGRVELGERIWMYGTSSIRGDGVLDTPALYSYGWVYAGNGGGTLELTGDYVSYDEARIKLQIGGGGEPGVDFDRFLIGGDATIVGSLYIDLLNNGRLPEIGDRYEVLHAQSLTGVFDEVWGDLAISGDRGFSVSYPDGQSVVVEVVALSLIPGDLNGDGFVGIQDLNKVLFKWNTAVTPGAWPLGDPSGDGFVGIDDLNFVLGNWNAGTPAGRSANIPEPGVGMILAVWAVLTHRHRSESSTSG